MNTTANSTDLSFLLTSTMEKIIVEGLPGKE